MPLGIDDSSPEPPKRNNGASLNVRWDVLDVWALDYLKYLGHIPPNINFAFRPLSSQHSDEISATEEQSEGPTACDVVEDTKAIRKSIMEGNIEVAIESLSRQFPSVAGDPTVAFHMAKQHLIELVRASQGQDPMELVAFVQQVRIADFADNAQPSASEELKRTLASIILSASRSPEGLRSSYEFDTERRKELSFKVHRAILQHIRVEEPQLPLTVKYLTLVHNWYNSFRSEPSPIAALTESLLLTTSSDNVDEPAKGVIDVVTIDPMDVSILAQAAGISPELAKTAIVKASILSKKLNTTFSPLELAMRDQISNLPTNTIMMSNFIVRYLEYRGVLLESCNKVAILRSDIFLAVHQPLLSSQYRTDTLIDVVKRYRHDFPDTSFATALWKIEALECIVRGRFQMEQADEDFVWWHKVVDILQNQLIHSTSPSFLLEIKEMSTLVIMKYPLPAIAQELGVIPILESHLKFLNKLRNNILEIVVTDYISSITLDEPPEFISLMETLLFYHEDWFRKQCADDRFQNVFHISELQTPLYILQFLEGASVLSFMPNPPMIALASAPTTKSGTVTKKSSSEPSVSSDGNSPGSGTSEEENAAIETIMDVLAVSREEAHGILAEYDGHAEAVLAALFP
ncbi:hypothetical protein HDU67_009708 [Dinochytrium kinnereticum]|nr:hypothetical protein HDU67_009708 [Dinochytrium kinnereticum]